LDYSEIIAFIPYQAMLRYGLKPPRKLEKLVKPVMALCDRKHTPETFEYLELRLRPAGPNWLAATISPG